ncbi:DUF4870 family protein [Marinobacterium sp. YM272]|uniref:DUF4870 family protein n=1 Tax=Marinobacterium sp. YM272 TaxID=3421654 RepID=UPI003D7FCC82
MTYTLIPEDEDRNLKNITTLVYALQAASFLIGISFLVALIINYVKLQDVRGTLYESHFRWQLRTFWYSAFWFFVGFLSTIILVGYAILAINTVWVIYRIIKGWLRLSEGRPMYID